MGVPYFGKLPYRGHFRIMENKLETTLLYIGVILG